MTDVIQKYVDMLGLMVRDKVTGFEGVVESSCFDLYGCIQLAVKPPMKDGDIKDGRWFDVSRLDVVSATRTMPVPSFAHLADRDGTHQKGPAEKPAQERR